MRFITGLLIGLGLGVATGLVLAPQSGETTRAQLTEQSIMLKDRALSDELRARAENVRARVTDAWGQGREVYQRTADELNNQYNRVRSGNLS